MEKDFVDLFEPHLIPEKTDNQEKGVVMDVNIARALDRSIFT